MSRKIYTNAMGESYKIVWIFWPRKTRRHGWKWLTQVRKYIKGSY
jgi:hypothetical protein